MAWDDKYGHCKACWKILCSLRDDPYTCPRCKKTGRVPPCDAHKGGICVSCQHVVFKQQGTNSTAGYTTNSTNTVPKKPYFWKSTGAIGEYDVPPRDSEYHNISRLFYQSFTSTQVTLLKVTRHENWELFRKFYYERERVAEQHNLGDYKKWQKYLFHGCRSSTLHKILSSGFKVEYASNQAVYGQGQYFAPDARLSIYFVHDANCTGSCTGCGHTRKMILCRVLVGHYSVVGQQPGVKQAPVGYTSATSKHKIEVVIFSNNRAYPEYILTFKVNSPLGDPYKDKSIQSTLCTLDNLSNLF